MPLDVRKGFAFPSTEIERFVSNGRHSLPNRLMNLIGKAEPYRTSSGKAPDNAGLKSVSEHAYSAGSFSRVNGSELIQLPLANSGATLAFAAAISVSAARFEILSPEEVAAANPRVIAGCTTRWYRAIATIARLATTIAMMEMIDILLITLRSISNQFHCSLMRAIVSCFHFAPRAAKAIHEITRTK
jgi:hypothetical protein